MNSNQIPPNVSIVLRQLAQRRAAREIAESEFQKKADRLRVEELDKRGLDLLVRDLADGDTRFIIKDRATQAVIDMVDCAPCAERAGHGAPLPT